VLIAAGHSNRLPLAPLAQHCALALLGVAIAPAAWPHASGCNGDELLTQAVAMIWLLSLAAGAVGLLLAVAIGMFSIGGPLRWRLLCWAVLLTIALTSASLLAWANFASLMGCISLPQRGALALLNMAPAELVRRLARYFSSRAQARSDVDQSVDKPSAQGDPGTQ
jgi:hypothetical protein